MARVAVRRSSSDLHRCFKGTGNHRLDEREANAVAGLLRIRRFEWNLLPTGGGWVHWGCRYGLEGHGFGELVTIRCAYFSQRGGGDRWPGCDHCVYRIAD